MADKLMYVLNDDTQNFYRLLLVVETNEPTNQIQEKSPKLLYFFLSKQKPNKVHC